MNDLLSCHDNRLLHEENAVNDIPDCWAASLPAEFMKTPYWLTNQAVDVIDRDSYNLLREEFMKIFEEEEKQQQVHQSGMQYSSIMKKGWEMGTIWYVLALQSPTGLNTLFYSHIQPYNYSEKHADDGNFYAITCLYWSRNTPAIIKKKVDEKKAYDEKLRQAFAEAESWMNQIDWPIDREKERC